MTRLKWFTDSTEWALAFSQGIYALLNRAELEDVQNKMMVWTARLNTPALPLTDINEAFDQKDWGKLLLALGTHLQSELEEVKKDNEK